MTKLRGFTLVELIVVIATIGILATITVIGLTRYQADTRDARRASSVSVIAEALEKYYDQNGEYPSCSAVSAASDVVTTTTLKGVSATTLQAPQAPTSETNSLECNGTALTIGGTDFFEYVGDGSTACTGSVACLSYTLKYKDEATGTIKTLASRRNTAIATSGAPTISVTDTDFDNITVGWTAVQNAASYVIERSSSAAFTSPTQATATASTLTKVMSGLSPASTYYFRVRGDSASSQGTWSNTVSATTISLAKPTCNSVADSNSQITTTWNSVASATSYSYRYSTASDMSGATTTTGIVVLNKVLTGLSTGVTYYIQVMAVNASFNSGWSVTCPATTFVPAPSSLAAVTDSATQITATWSSVAVATTYTLEYSTSSSFTSPTAITGLTAVTRAVTGLTQGKTYYFRVFALVSTTSSVASPTASATTTVNTPSAPNASAYTPGAVRAYSAGDWIAWIDSPASGNWYYSYGTGSGTCPSGTTKMYSFRAQYNDPTTLYGWSSFSSENTRYMVDPDVGYAIRFYVRMRCDGTDAVSGISGSDSACATHTSSNVACTPTWF